MQDYRFFYAVNDKVIREWHRYLFQLIRLF